MSGGGGSTGRGGSARECFSPLSTCPQALLAACKVQRGSAGGKQLTVRRFEKRISALGLQYPPDVTIGARRRPTEPPQPASCAAAVSGGVGEQGAGPRSLLCSSLITLLQYCLRNHPKCQMLLQKLAAVGGGASASARSSPLCKADGPQPFTFVLF